MKILDKLKGIIFEEVDEPEEKKKIVKEEKPIAEKIEVKRPEVKPKPEVKKEEAHVEPVKEASSFTFPDFDEAEFSRSQKPKSTTNVLEYERKRKTEKKYDLGRYERIEKTEVVEKKKFKPSPIISPVYGILNEDYNPDDIKDKTNTSESLDFNAIRKKAFETPGVTTYKESVTVKVKEDEEEKKQKVKTIDELLEDTSDITIEIPSITKETKEEYDNVDNDLDELDKKNDNNSKDIEDVDGDEELENDLFDLIDSMYDEKEDE